MPVGASGTFHLRAVSAHRADWFNAVAWSSDGRGAITELPVIIVYADGDRLVSEQEAKTHGLKGNGLLAARRELSDGLLTAYELMGMDLTGTEVVMLTACESGIGVTPEGEGHGLRQAEGESVAGLRQSLMVAGAQAVVMSMWLVPLEATAVQMQSFLERWLAGGLPRYQAFRESQLAALERARRSSGGGHPFWWAGFIYAGDPGDR